jgi:hypothetical protein
MSEIKTIKFKAPLFRANKNLFRNGILKYRANMAKKGILASNNYKNAPTKYFTLKRNEVNAYTKEGRTYTKNWNVIEELNLVDILDLKTRKALEDKFKNHNVFINAISEAFPINGNIVRRISSSTKEDNEVLNKICELGYDGYYMNIEGKNIGFHSEVGLCNNAFHKLKLMNDPKMKYVANRTIKRKQHRYNNNDNNNNNNNNNEFNSRRQRAKLRMIESTIPKFSLF